MKKGARKAWAPIRNNDSQLAVIGGSGDVHRPQHECRGVFAEGLGGDGRFLGGTGRGRFSRPPVHLPGRRWRLYFDGHHRDDLWLVGDCPFGLDSGHNWLVHDRLARLVHDIRLAGARQHLDAVLIYEVIGKSEADTNLLGFTNVLLGVVGNRAELELSIGGRCERRAMVG